MKRTLTATAVAILAAGLSLAGVSTSATAAPTNCGTTVSTSSDAAGWDFSQTRTGGHNDYVATGLHVYTDSNTSLDKAAGYRALSIPLGDAGTPTMTVTDATGVLPALQLGIDLTGDGTWDGYLVNEPASYGADQWWTNKTTFGVTPGGGYPSMGTLADYLAANPAAKVTDVGYSLGSGVKGDAIITSISAGCSAYEFTSVVPAQPAPVVTTTTVAGSDVTDCTAKTVTSTTSTSTVNSVLVNNVWVAQAPVVTTGTSVRPATETECPTAVVVPVKPADAAPVVVTGTPRVSCSADADSIVLTDVTTTTTPWVLVDNVWVAGTPVAVTVTDQRPATETECPTAVVIPLDTTPTASVSGNGQLAHTGYNLAPAGLFAGIFLAAGTAFVALRKRFATK